MARAAVGQGERRAGAAVGGVGRGVKRWVAGGGGRGVARLGWPWRGRIDLEMRPGVRVAGNKGKEREDLVFLMGEKIRFVGKRLDRRIRRYPTVQKDNPRENVFSQSECFVSLTCA